MAGTHSLCVTVSVWEVEIILIILFCVHNFNAVQFAVYNDSANGKD